MKITTTVSVSEFWEVSDEQFAALDKHLSEMDQDWRKNPWMHNDEIRSFLYDFTNPIEDIYGEDAGTFIED
jgi:hypothetical protein